MLKKEFRYFTIGDYEDEELWLRERHRNGWKMTHFTVPGFYTFESCEPEDVIYRLDFKGNKQTPDYLQMAADFGWEYFAECSGWLYFRKSAAVAEADGESELFSDDASRVETVDHITRTRLVPLAIIFVCLLLPNLFMALNGVMGGFSTFFAAFFGIFVVFYVWLIVHSGIKLQKIRDRMILAR